MAERQDPRDLRGDRAVERRRWVRGVWADWEGASPLERRWLLRFCVHIFTLEDASAWDREAVVEFLSARSGWELAAPSVEVIGGSARDTARRERETEWGAAASAYGLRRRYKRLMREFEKEWA